MMIPAEAVEAAKLALAARLGYQDDDWEPEVMAILEAAAPYIAAQAWDETSSTRGTPTGVKMKHAKTDPACINYKESGPFRRYLNERGRGKNCNVCVPPKRGNK